ncbi:fluoride efflux transporter FluC [Frigoribacterium salinisoli]
MTARPLHLRGRSLALVALGGALGTALREVIALSAPAPAGSVPWSVLAINVTGAAVLGLLLEGLARGGPDEGRRRDLRLLLGTGVLGGFTTYSALAVDTALLGDGHLPVALGYGAGSVVAGLLAAAVGIAAARALDDRRRRREAP